MNVRTPADSMDHIDLKAFAADLDALRARVKADLGPADLAHLRKMERWGRTATAVGYAAAFIPNPLSVALLSYGRTVRWTMVAHHVLHRGYDQVPGVPPSRTSKGFAKGWRRYIDWLDWIEREAWIYEHNRVHHYRLGETLDPDRVDLNLAFLSNASWPQPLKRAFIWSAAMHWKATYFASTTVFEVESRDRPKPAKRGRLKYLTNALGRRRYWTGSILPYATVQFGLIPGLFLPFGPAAAASVLLNSLAAEVVTNLHTFIVITPNHTGDDVAKFEGKVGGRGEFYARQVEGSVNFTTGSDWIDALHGFLNYQIEHHVFPDLPMRQYQRIQPQVKAICEKHGVKYTQQSVWKRLRKTLDVMTGAQRP